MHPGLHEDMENIDRNREMGKVTPYSHNVNQVIKAQTLSGLADKFNDISELRNQTHKKEPLGRGYQRNYAWPSAVKNDFSFG